MSRIPCERCPVRLALKEEERCPGKLYKLQKVFADVLGDTMGYSSEQYSEYLQTVSEGMEASVEECPGVSKFKYYLGKIGTRFLKYTNVRGMPNSVEADVVCNNPYLETRPDSMGDCTQNIGAIWVEY